MPPSGWSNEDRTSGPGRAADIFRSRGSASSDPDATSITPPAGSGTGGRPGCEGRIADGTVIGHFTLKRLIGSGGMGRVYEARQENPRRTVAIKVMNRGTASRSALRRFEFEAQVLARLKHPGIAQIHEAGTFDDGTGGVPWFAMEYIGNAKSVTDYARDARLRTRQRVQLFRQACEAVAHGHQRGVIHRDLKPGNLLVDGGGQLKVIDFGVARSTDSDLAATTMQTDVGELIGTVQYMSPEQFDADPHDLDIRSDVYALGVVLYELLTGQAHGSIAAARGERAAIGARGHGHALAVAGVDGQRLGVQGRLEPAHLEARGEIGHAEPADRLQFLRDGLEPSRLQRARRAPHRTHVAFAPKVGRGLLGALSLARQAVGDRKSTRLNSSHRT